MQRFVIALGAFAILAASFFATLYLLNSLNFGPVNLDRVRIEHAKSLKAAIERYRAARGKYPSPFPDNDLADLRPELVSGGFISELPLDPYWKIGKVNRYRYRSDGNTYGLMFYLELGPCQTGAGALAVNPWKGQKIAPCAF